MTNDDIKRIAEGLGYHTKEVDGVIYTQQKDTEKDWYADFNPLTDWRDCSLLLEEIVAESDIQITHSCGRYYLENDSYADSNGEGETLMAAICDSYLNWKGLRK